jgi:hypothetical protein
MTQKNMKKIVLLVISLCLGLLHVSAQTTHHSDVNNDGEVNISDAILIINHILGKLPPGEAIDLGLPSGTKWASYNIGATKPEEMGSFFAWGESEVKEEYGNNYTYYDSASETYQDLGSNISGTQYDTAHLLWGANWRMPTWSDFKEMQSNCTKEWVIINGMYGSKFTSKINGKSIFFPAAGIRWYNEWKDYHEPGQEDRGFYWLAQEYASDISRAYNLIIFRTSDGYNANTRVFGMSIRPVAK